MKKFNFLNFHKKKTEKEGFQLEIDTFKKNLLGAEIILNLNQSKLSKFHQN